MATNPAAREYYHRMVHYIRKDVTFGDTGKVLTIGTIPARSLILNTLSGVHVSTVFNAGTNNFLDIGTAADDDLYGTDVSLLTLGLILMDEAESAAARYVTVDTTFTVTVTLSGTAATTGAAEVLLCYVPPEV